MGWNGTGWSVVERSGWSGVESGGLEMGVETNLALVLDVALYD